MELSDLRFRHRCALLGSVPDDVTAAGTYLHEVYDRAMDALELHAKPASGVVPSYNVVLTRRWLLVVPRAQSEAHGISVNSLGFAGTFLVKSPAALASLRAQGPFAVLAAVSQPRL